VRGCATQWARDEETRAMRTRVSTQKGGGLCVHVEELGLRRLAWCRGVRAQSVFSQLRAFD